MTTSTIPVDKNGRAYAVGQRVQLYGRGKQFTVTEIRDGVVRTGPELGSYFADPHEHVILDPPAAERKAVAKDCDGTELFVGDIVVFHGDPEHWGRVIDAHTAASVGNGLRGAYDHDEVMGCGFALYWRLLHRASSPAPRDTTPSPAPEEPSLRERYAAFRAVVEAAAPKGVLMVTDTIDCDGGCGALVEMQRDGDLVSGVFPWTMVNQHAEALLWMRTVVDGWDRKSGKAMREGSAMRRGT